VSAGLNGPLNPSSNLFDVARVGVDFGGGADTRSEARIGINYGAIIAQPHSKDRSSFPSLRTSSNRMRRFFMTSSLECGVHRTRSPDLANEAQRHRALLVHVAPFEPNFQELRHAIVSQALNPTVVNGMMFKGQGSRRCSQSTTNANSRHTNVKKASRGLLHQALL